jgi:catechol 2,3-dioxygenase-like lactoylglutathione lyase family enzyme
VSAGFDHLTIVVTDLDDAKRFFGTLGFAESHSVVVNGPTMAAYMGISDWEADHVTLVDRGAPVHQEIQLLRFHQPASTVDGGSGDLGRTGFSHLCLRVDDLDAAVARLAEIGRRPRNEVMAFHDRRLVFFDGPAGVVVELAEWQSDPGVTPS